MKKQIFIIGGGDVFETHEEYIDFLKTFEVSLEDFSYKGWKKNLGAALPEYDIFPLQMPCSFNAKYTEWKIWFEKFVPFMHDEVVLVGISLGGIFLTKFLSENTFPKKVRSLHLIAAPFNDESQESLGDFRLQADVSVVSTTAEKIFLYHSSDDPVVPITEVDKYADALPQAIVRRFVDRGHFHVQEFPELEEDIRNS